MPLIWHKTEDGQFGFKFRANGDNTAPAKSILKSFVHFTRRNHLNTADADHQTQAMFEKYWERALTGDVYWLTS